MQKKNHSLDKIQVISRRWNGNNNSRAFQVPIHSHDFVGISSLFFLKKKKGFAASGSFFFASANIFPIKNWVIILICRKKNGASKVLIECPCMEYNVAVYNSVSLIDRGNEMIDMAMIWIERKSKWNQPSTMQFFANQCNSLKLKCTFYHYNSILLSHFVARAIPFWNHMRNGFTIFPRHFILYIVLSKWALGVSGWLNLSYISIVNREKWEQSWAKKICVCIYVKSIFRNKMNYEHLLTL